MVDECVLVSDIVDLVIEGGDFEAIIHHFHKYHTQPTSIIDQEDSHSNNTPTLAYERYQSLLLSCAYTHGHTELTRKLVTDGWNINTPSSKRATYSLPLHLAVFEGDVDSARFFLEHGADLDVCVVYSFPATRSSLTLHEWHRLCEKPMSALDLCMVLDKREMLREALIPYCPPNVLLVACRHGARRCAEYLLAETDCDVNECHQDPFSPIMHAIPHGAEIIKLLLRYGAKVNTRTPDSHGALTCLQLLCSRAHCVRNGWLPKDAPIVCRLLLEAGSLNNTLSSAGETLAMLCQQVFQQIVGPSYSRTLIRPSRPYPLLTHRSLVLECMQLILSQPGLSINSGSMQYGETMCCPFTQIIGNMGVVLHRREMDMNSSDSHSDTELKHRTDSAFMLCTEILKLLLDTEVVHSFKNKHWSTKPVWKLVHTVTYMGVWHSGLFNHSYSDGWTTTSSLALEDPNRDLGLESELLIAFQLLALHGVNLAHVDLLADLTLSLKPWNSGTPEAIFDIICNTIGSGQLKELSRVGERFTLQMVRPGEKLKFLSGRVPAAAIKEAAMYINRKTDRLLSLKHICCLYIFDKCQCKPIVAFKQLPVPDSIKQCLMSFLF